MKHSGPKSDDADWPERLAVRIARCYYELDMTQWEIASELGIGRTRVIRLLADARERGIISIRINSPLLVTIPQGELVAHDINQRVLGVRLKDFRRIRRRVMISGGPNKVPALRALLEQGLITALVTDEKSARALL